MGSKGPSGNTTTTVQNTNPAAQAQLPYLQQLWGSAMGLMPGNQNGAGGSIMGFGLGADNSPLNQIFNYAAGQGANYAGLGGQIMSPAYQTMANLIGMGIPGTTQANMLTNNASAGANLGNQYGGAMQNAANNITGQAPTWGNLLQGTGASAIGDLSGIGNYAMNTLPAMGQGALSGLSGLSGQAGVAGNPAEAGLYGASGMAISGNPIYDSLRGMASGQYINPSTNPALAGTLKAATDPLVNQYMRATAPQTDSAFEGAGRYGSGAMASAQANNQYNLGQALGSATSNIVNNAYNTGLQSTLGAGSALGQAFNQGIANTGNLLTNAGQMAQAGVNNAGNLLNAGYTTGGNLINQGIGGGTQALSNAYNIGGGLYGNAANTNLNYLNTGLQGLGAAGGLQNQFLGTANTGLTGAGNVLNYGDIAATSAAGQAPTFANYPTSQWTAAENAPFLPYSNLASIIGGAIPGQGTQTTSQPYYSNTAANVIGGLGGIASLGNSLMGIFSDRRLKRDVRRIGELRNGLPVYRFRYLGDNRLTIGLMADEVARVHPDAVIAVGAMRLQRVDYRKAVR